ncbi:hypothetical protein AV530_012803 [Patagioenas fasciata monilis]|uniref:Uncharacterized protein n=1 Tax=Patagioenas fasciata monilis TaxID=372326 RepID=A0A1V4J9K3_PATFA|nr:hypothetical protein AV530_012803 [Patagioenas fasciata monilis]
MMLTRVEFCSACVPACVTSVQEPACCLGDLPVVRPHSKPSSGRCLHRESRKHHQGCPITVTLQPLQQSASYSIETQTRMQLAKDSLEFCKQALCEHEEEGKRDVSKYSSFHQKKTYGLALDC